MMEISTELLSEVYREHLDNNDTKEVHWVQEGTRPYQIAYRLDTGAHYVNVYQLAHECKKWAYRQGYPKLLSYYCEHATTDAINGSNNGVVLLHYPDKAGVMTIKAPTEPEAILKACQWIQNSIKEREEK